MSKIICDICGTTYPETAEKCPICGCSRDAAAEFLGEEFLGQQVEEEAKGKSGRFTSKKKKEIFDFDEVNEEAEELPVEEENPFTDEETPYEEEKKGSNVFVVILLTVLIAALLLAAGFIYFRYFVPNQEDGEAATTEAVTLQTEQTEDTTPAVPCEMLVLTSGTAELSQEGQMFLLHVKPTPEDTTDEIVFASADESIATVTADGKVTAVAEGETEILITCGNIQTTCPVVVSFVEETVPPTTEAPAETAAPETTAPAETAAPVQTEPAVKDVKLKLKKTDIRLGVYYEFQLELDCDLEQNEVQWRSEHSHIATVDANGVVKAVKSGTTSIIAKYGDQEVSCIVRCVN